MSTGRWRLLVVDDNEDNRYMLTERLAREGYRDVVTATNGREALDCVRQQDIDLVLLDIMMPEMNGYQVLEALHADPKRRSIPVIVISATDQIEAAIRCIELGAEDYLPKPFNPTLLRARIGAILEKKRLRDEVDRHVARIDRELQLARDIQLAMVPTDFPGDTARSPFSVHAVLAPARELGGDLYDFFWLTPERLCLVVADVSDKGMPAALFMARTKTAIRMAATHAEQSMVAGKPSADELMARINDELCRDNPHAMFVATLLCLVDAKSGAAEWCAAGQPPPYVIGPDGQAERLPGNIGSPLGLPLPYAFEACGATLAPGATLFLYTDGITESMNATGELFGDARLRAAICAAASRTPREMLAAVCAELRAFRGAAEPSDDIAAIACRWMP
jgi:sigma-B regulation protein RsbU (phosphoserine phosphatase)